MISVKRWNRFFLETRTIQLLLIVMVVDLVISTYLSSILRLQGYHQDVNGQVCIHNE